LSSMGKIIRLSTIIVDTQQVVKKYDMYVILSRVKV
jgi:hypothetical protein